MWARAGVGDVCVEVDGWRVEGKWKVEQSRRKGSGKKREACQPMFSASVWAGSRKPVTSCSRSHTNQDVDMCTLSARSGNRQSLHRSYNVLLSLATSPQHTVNRSLIHSCQARLEMGPLYLLIVSKMDLQVFCAISAECFRTHWAALHSVDGQHSVKAIKYF